MKYSWLVFLCLSPCIPALLFAGPPRAGEPGEIPPGGPLGHHPTELGVVSVLREGEIGQEVAVTAQHRHGGVVEGGINGQAYAFHFLSTSDLM